MKKNYFSQKSESVLELFFKQKYILLLVALTLFPGNFMTAQTAGPNYPPTSGATFTPGPNVDWTNPGFLNADDTNYATAVMTSGQSSDFLRAVNYGFSIPPGAVINGITVSIMRQSNSVNSSRSVQDLTVNLLKNGTIAGNNYAATSVLWPITMTAANYGGNTDLWGAGWTATDINNANFGVQISVNSPFAARTASVDYITITVTYTPAPTVSSFTVTSACTGSTPSIVITGNHFNTATNVSFNGTSASFTINSNTQITATLPAGATTGTITVTSPSGTGTSATNFTVNALPVLSAITGNSSFCIGSTTPLANSTPGGSWDSASTGVATINSSGVVSSVSAGTSLITYTYTNGNGCTNSVNTTVTVNALPVVTSPASVCVGSTVQLTPNSGGTWTSSDNTKATVDNTGLVTGVAAGSPTFTFTNSITNCSKTTNTVNILALPTISSQPTATQTICSGSSVSFSVIATGPGLTYQWYNGATALSNVGSITGATSATLTINPVTLGDASANYNCVVSGACSPAATSANAELIVIEKVTITSQPATTQTLCTGDTASFFVAAIGAGISFQWYKGATALVNSASISGATTSTLTLSSLALTDAANNYYCLVSGTSPCSAVASSFARLNVNLSISITSQPATTQTVCSLGSASFTVAATGTALTYQWYNGVTPLSNGGAVSGATSATLSINPVSLSHASANYNCVISGSCSPSVSSANAELIVNEKLTLTSQPVTAQTLCTGDTATLSVGATGTGISFQWYKGVTALVDGGTISGATTDTLSISPLAGSDAGTNYHCLVSGASPCSSVASANSILNVNQSASITTQPQVSQTVCQNGSVSITVVATGGSLVYQWYKGATLLSNGGNISGATSATLTFNPVALGDAASNYNCLITNGCSSGVNSADAEIIINEAVVITSQPAITQTVCVGSPASFSVTATGTGLSYQWYKGATLLNNGGSISGATSATLTINPIVTGDAATNYRCVVSGVSPCAAVSSNNAALVVNQLPAITSQPAASQTLCSGSSASFSVTATGTNLTYQWFNGATPMANGGSITGVTTATLTINPVSTSNTSSNYHCVVSGSCSPAATSNNAALIVNQSVAITSQPVLTQTVCVATPVSFSITATGTGLSYQWYKGATILNNGGSISGATSATLTINSVVTGDAATNYRCVVSGTSPCTAVNSNNAALVVNQLPAITSQPTASQTLCSGNSVSFSVIATGAGLTYQWYNGATLLSNGGSITGATTATLTINPVSTSDASTNYHCFVSGSCSPGANSNNATLIINSLSVGGTALITHTANSAGTMIALSTPINTHSDCHLSSGSLALSGHTGTVLRWESSINAGNTWVNLGNAGNTTYTYSSLTVTTIFRAVIQNASCNTIYSAHATLFIIPNIKPTPISASPSTICIGQSTTLTSLSGFSSSQNIQYGGLFNIANPAGWTVNGNGVFSASGDNGNTTTFKETNGNASSEYNTISDDKFAIVRGNVNSTLETPVFDLILLSSAFLTFDHAHKLTAGAWGKVELSFDGGTSYPITLATYTGNQGPYNQFNTGVSLDLNPYLGYTNLRIRFNFHGLVAKSAGIDGDAWVIDNVTIPQAPVPALTSLWTDTTANTTISILNTTNTTVYPTVTTTYAVTSFLNGCTSYGPEGTTYITVTVNQLPIVTASPTTACSGDVNSIPLSSAVVGTQTSTLFDWTVAQTDATGGSAGSGTSINQTLIATGTVQGTVTYTITPTANGCIGPATTIIARVNPRPKADIQPSQTICYGETATFSVVLEGTGPWDLTYSNGVSTTTVNGITTSPYTFSVSGMTINRTFTITALSDSRCSARSQDLTGAAVVTVLNGVQGLWTGLVSTDWFDCKNWAGGLPSNTIDAQIPTTTIAGRMPIIDRTSPFAAAYNFIASARDLIVASNASVTMVAVNNSELQISSDWKNSGTFIPGTGTVTFNGATLNQIQNINVGIKTNEAFYNLTLNNSNGAKGISVVDGFELTVSNDLSLLSGDLRLVGEAQLVQNGAVANPSSGSGKILIDQQGNRSSYHYNYWSSPVTTNGINYSLSGVLRDGTDSATNTFNPSPITFGGGAYFADGAITTPVKLSTRWLFKYTSVSTVYAGWQAIGDTGTVGIGEGFTMKGVTGIAPFTAPQNYVFVGKPNNGTIPLSISLNQSYLVGNPYASALDADEFIKDNIKDGAGRAATNIFNGALYFWDHFGGQSHILNQYIGGYASYTLMGGVVAISNDPLVNANGAMGTRVPKQYIPVAQGFFIGTGSNSALTVTNPGLSTPVTGGTISFKNSQRAFKVESATNSVFFKSNNQNQTVNNDVDTRQKIRLLYQSPSNIFRQILVGVDENATSFFDVGYDAPIVDENAEDLYWNTIDAKLTIQAVSNFDEQQVIPLGLKTSTAGICTIKVDTLENISEDTQLYIHDAETGIDYNIKNADFTISLPIGIYNDRFSLRFSGSALGTNNPVQNNDPVIYFTNSNNILNINSNEIIKTVKLYNILGQFISEYNVENETVGTIQIPLLKTSSGTYIVKIITEENKVFSKKIQKK